MTIRIGDVIALGNHRLMCGDSTNPQHVAALMQDELASMCVTSPPYASQRDYSSKIQDWDVLMQGVFSIAPMTDAGQILVNLGLIYRDHEWVEYYSDWLTWMSGNGWRRYGWYVWDKLNGAPGQFHGRLCPAHEWVFHFNKIMRIPNRTVPKQSASIGLAKLGTGLRLADGSMSGVTSPQSLFNTHKIPDSVFRLHPEKANGLARMHPAVFPVQLPQSLIETWSSPAEIIYEPFCGSGSTILAAERCARRCYGMEISPEYCEIAVKRWEQEIGIAPDMNRCTTTR